MLLQNSVIFSSLITKVIVDINQIKLNIATVNIHMGSSFLSSMIHVYQTSVTFSGYVEISNVSTSYALKAPIMYVEENSVINFTSNNFFQGLMFSKELSLKVDTLKIRECPIQYMSNRGNLDMKFQMGQKLNFTIVIKRNYIRVLFNVDLIHCSWDPSSTFFTSRPSVVNQRFIVADQIDETSVRSICLCNVNNKQDCHEDEIGPMYAGQNVLLSFSLNHNSTFPKKAHVQAITDPVAACKIDKLTIIIL